MAEPSQKIWSNNPNAPRIPSWVHRLENSKCAGGIIGAMSYGIVITLFFQCMNALLNPDIRMGRGVKWWLVIHAVAMFLFTTISVVVEGHRYSISHIDNREFPGVVDVSPPGTWGYYMFTHSTSIAIVSSLMVPLIQWLSDGLLLYRWFVIYSMNSWFIAFPCLMYLGAVVTGIVYICGLSNQAQFVSDIASFRLSYLIISLTLNVLLTLMVIVRLVLHNRSFRNAIGSPDGVSGLYTTVAAMLIESSALYATAYLLYLVPIAIRSCVSHIFSLAFGGAQVIAPLLLILRVANRRAVTSDVVSSEGAGSIQFRNGGGSTGDDGSFPDVSLVGSAEMNCEASGGPSAADENAIEEVPL